MDPRHPPGIHRSRTLAVLPRGVHLPLQSAHFPQPWARFPEAPRTGSSHRTDHRSERHPWLQLAKISTYVMGGANRLPHLMNINENDLRTDSRVERLLKNPNWRPAAEAAIAYVLRGVSCPIASWRKSSTWA